tara:strand:+ start:4035 stop:4331 length:297 start_codon:yes stop_codon:yes gene_type:complete
MTEIEKQNRAKERGLRKKWQDTSEKYIVDFCLGVGLHVKCLNKRNRHYRIEGNRDVELYATTGTVNAKPSNGKGAINVKLMEPERALKRAATIAMHGY